MSRLRDIFTAFVYLYLHIFAKVWEKYSFSSMFFLLKIDKNMKKILLITFLFAFIWDASAQRRRNINYSIISVPEEGGVKFEKITDDADAVAIPFRTQKTKFSIGKKDISSVTWWVNPLIALSPDGSKIGYVNYKNDTRNIMIKSSSAGGASVQRTFRTGVMDFTWSKDGKTLCFTELRGGHAGIYLVNADQGSVVQQISTGTENDYGGVLTPSGDDIFFHRGENFGAFSLWSFNRKTNLFSNYSRGMTPCLIPGDPNTLYCCRFTDKHEAEIWRINFKTGVEEVILAQPGRSFTTPRLSPDGRWLLCTGASISEKEKRMNTDIFVVRTDGTGFTQLTYHPGNDLSAIWGPDGKSIYFLSQRGTKLGNYNVWRMDFNL